MGSGTRPPTLQPRDVWESQPCKGAHHWGFAHVIVDLDYLDARSDTAIICQAEKIQINTGKRDKPCAAEVGSLGRSEDLGQVRAGATIV
jgi:hypothetical protein